MYADQYGIHHNGGNNGLHDADDSRLFAGVFEVGQAEFVADIKGNKSQRNVRYNGKSIHGGDGTVKSETETADNESPQAVGADKDTRNKVGGYIGEFEMLENTRHHKACKKTDRDAEQRLNGRHGVFPFRMELQTHIQAIPSTRGRYCLML